MVNNNDDILWSRSPICYNNNEEDIRKIYDFEDNTRFYRYRQLDTVIHGVASLYPERIYITERGNRRTFIVVIF